MAFNLKFQFAIFVAVLLFVALAVQNVQSQTNAEDLQKAPSIPKCKAYVDNVRYVFCTITRQINLCSLQCRSKPCCLANNCGRVLCQVD